MTTTLIRNWTGFALLFGISLRRECGAIVWTVTPYPTELAARQDPHLPDSILLVQPRGYVSLGVYAETFLCVELRDDSPLELTYAEADGFRTRTLTTEEATP